MDDLLKMIYMECLERFGTSTEVNITVDSDGIRLTTESMVCSRKAEWMCYDQKKIDGEHIAIADK